MTFYHTFLVRRAWPVGDELQAGVPLIRIISRVASSSSETLLRRLLLTLLALGVVGVSTEFVLLDHYEDGWQVVPFVVLGLGLVSIVWHAVTGGSASLRLLRMTMVLFLATGGAGILLHYRGNLEFQREINPAQSQWDLFKKVIHAKAPPALAPAAMAQLGLLGLAYAFRHPALGTPLDDVTRSSKGSTR